MTRSQKCILCQNQAEHQLSYRNVKEKVAWYGDYCTNCFVKKLRDMEKVWNDKIKKFCSKCNAELKDKRFDRCDVCLGLVYNMESKC